MTVKEARNAFTEIISTESDENDRTHFEDLEMEMTRLIWAMKDDKKVTEL